MRTDDVFNDIDSRTADRLAKEYPVLRDEQKERLYAMSKRKFDIKIDNSSIDVSGVEKYRRPRWFKGVSVAAAALLLVSGIGGSMYYISRNGKAPAAEVEESISETTEVTTEALTEEQTDAEIDADAVAKSLIDDYREFMCVLYGGDLEVDKSDIITRAITLPDNDVTFDREFYRVTDSRFPTWADIEKRCYEILDTELAQRILEISTENTEDIMGNPFFCVTEDGYYHETGLHDNGIDPLSTSEYDMDVHTDENGNIIATIVETELREVHDYPIPETTFTIVETPNGWRISDVTEKPLDEETDNSTDADAIAKELTGAYRDFSNDLHGGNLEVDKNNVVTKTIISSDGVELQREFYLVTDLRYPTWADIEKRCFEIFDEKFGKVVLDNCMCDKEDDINYDTFMYTTDNGYYIEKYVHDGSMGPHDWDEDIVNAETDENGNIITVLHRSSFDGAGNKYTVETDFTITNTENGWRISDVTEKPVEENE
ncbi:MAG: hypothetical protein IKH96_03980 [Ruminococcus sp.]|uniref:hypothetical protein n=1 Tax=Ruminococcus sp. TaxID=41978 RepID=UPI0025E8B2CF|nr:hypothetical protein [Ruminococcus sp.]MBR6995159.1 hypothetical protein [Ruminococcus sp.]